MPIPFSDDYTAGPFVVTTRSSESTTVHTGTHTTDSVATAAVVTAFVPSAMASTARLPSTQSSQLYIRPGEHRAMPLSLCPISSTDVAIASANNKSNSLGVTECVDRTRDLHEDGDGGNPAKSAGCVWQTCNSRPTVFSARQHICYSALYDIARPSLCPSVRHTGGSVKDA